MKITKNETKPVTAIAVAALLAMIAGCSSDENGPIGTGGSPTPAPTMGTAQKGPYINGSEVVITPLNAFAEPSDVSVNTRTIDDLGNFEFNAVENILYDISVNGIYYNEVSGELSTEQLQLKAFFLNTHDKNRGVYINVLTHIVYERILLLIENGLTPDSAFTQAQSELLTFVHDTLFVIATNNLTFHHLGLYDTDTTDEIGSAILLYMTATLYEYARLFYPGPNSVERALNEVSDNFKESGNISGSIDDLRDAAANIDPVSVRDNLIEYSRQVLGTALAVPDLNLVLDTDIDTIINNVDPDDDGDGIPDINDRDPYRFEILPEHNQSAIVQSGVNTIITLNFNIPEDGDFEIRAASPLVGSIDIIDKLTNTILYLPPEDSPAGPDQFTYRVASTYRVTPAPDVGEEEYISEEVTVLINPAP